jgi:hypothetical protein
MGDQEKDIFNITLNKDGATWILRFCKIVQTIILFSIIYGFISILYSGLRINFHHPGLYATRPALKYEYLIHPYYSIAYIIIWMVQVYFFFRFRNGIKKAVVHVDSEEFNNSFSDMYKMTKLSLVLLILNLISFGYSLFLLIKYPV